MLLPPQFDRSKKYPLLIQVYVALPSFECCCFVRKHTFSNLTKPGTFATFYKAKEKLLSSVLFVMFFSIYFWNRNSSWRSIRILMLMVRSTFLRERGRLQSCGILFVDVALLLFLFIMRQSQSIDFSFVKWKKYKSLLHFWRRKENWAMWTCLLRAFDIIYCRQKRQ